jgi:hypothetical protein
MVKPLAKKIRNKERLWMFRSKFIRLYEEFEANMESLCQKYGVKIAFWYSPSKIHQPSFMFGKVAVDADTLYDEKQFSCVFSPKIVLDKQLYMKKERFQLKNAK